MDRTTLLLKRLSVTVFLCTIGFAGLAVVCFLQWMMQSSLFGHNYHSGPPELLSFAFGAAAATVVMSLVWAVTLIALFFRRRGNHENSGRIYLKYALSSGLIGLLVLLALGIMAVSSAELPEARKQALRTRAGVLSALPASDAKGPRTESEVWELVAGLESDDEILRQTSASALAQFGADAKLATPALIAAVRSREELTSWEAATALGNIASSDTETVSALVDALDGDSVLKDKATIALRKIGSSGRQALIDRLATADTGQRIRALEALSWFSNDSNDLIDPISQLLNDTDPATRTATMQALGRFSDSGPMCIELLVAQLDDPDPKIKLAAMEAIGKLFRHANAAVPKLTKLMRDKDDVVSKAALQTLAKVAPQSQSAIEVLILDLAKPEDLAKANAAIRLAYMGPKAVDALPALMLLLDNDEPNVRLRAAQAVWKISGDVTLVVPVLIDVYKGAESELSDAYSLRWNAAKTLGEMGRSAAAAIPMLREFAEHDDLRFASSAKNALQRIDVPDESALSTHLDRLKDQNVSVRRKAIVRIGQFGAEAAEAVPALIECLGEKDLFLRLDAAQTLRKIGPPAAAALPALREMQMEGGDSRINTCATQAIKAITIDQPVNR